MYSNFSVSGTNTSTYCPARVYHSHENLNGLYIQEKEGTVKVILKGPRRVMRHRKGDAAVGELCYGIE